MTNAAEEAIKAFEVNDATKELKSKMQLAFAALIPEEQWDELLKAEFEKFIKPQYKQGYHNREKHPSKLSVLAQSCINDMFKEKIEESLKSGNWTGYTDWVEGKGSVYMVSDAVEEYLNKHKEEFVEIALKQLIGHTIQEAIATMQGNLQRNTY